MKLTLARLPETLKGPDDDVYHGHVPRRALFLAPDARDALLRLETASGGLVYSDIFRSADASLQAMRTKRGVKAPGMSGHNYGLSLDLDLGACLRRLGKRYPDLVGMMQDHGWFCHRRDLDATAAEAWHFNYLGKDPTKYIWRAIAEDRRTWGEPIEVRIRERYEHSFHIEPDDVQRALAQLGIYSGAFDGEIGPLSREALLAFQKAWDLTPDGYAGPRTTRLLAYLTADKDIVL